MRKNPYNKDLKDQAPLIMQGPDTIIALFANEEQKVVIKKSMVPTSHEYKANSVSFTTVQPSVFNTNRTINPRDILNVEMGRTEVTQVLFKAVMGWDDSYAQDNLQKPVENITWFDCISFCNKLSELLGLRLCYEMSRVEKSDEYPNSIESAEVMWNETANGFRLPTEYEWESFAKAGTQNAWSGTNVDSGLYDYAWYRYNSGNETHPAGGRLPNEWGLFDMSGNVWEWCWDKFRPDDDTSRALRGGCCGDSSGNCIIERRLRFAVGGRDSSLGFRICRTIK